MKKKYDCQHVWFDRHLKKLKHADGQIEWDKDDPNSKPLLITFKGEKVSLEKDRLIEQKRDDGTVYFIYRDYDEADLSKLKAENRDPS